ncbi:phage tail protein [Azospirillum doebereinerae]|uniref:Phage tail protein n=2 Tax=Azospirillum doebereinerae TaxID=92933 RepID=A0A3S0V8L5_9PROT|nr:phage tail protein [Azospirillum doebereinerae]RUQ75234.1 phage tail protein [Azospirillum doebereinerae]
MLGLGDFRFEVGTAAYQAMQRNQLFRWAKQDRIGRLPALQFTGPDLQTVTLNGVIFPAFSGGLGQIPAMREMAARGEPLELVAGTGAVLGLWCILKVEEKQGEFLGDGRPRQVDFTLELQEYGDDAPPGAPSEDRIR